MSDKSFFTQRDNSWFLPTDYTRGPWHEDHCHAGPPTGLMARSIEQLNPSQRLVRLTVNLMRPIPMAGFKVESHIERTGRIVTHSSVQLTDADDKVCATAIGLQMTPQPEQDFPTQKTHHGAIEDATPGGFPIQKFLHSKTGFNSGAEVRYPPGHSNDPGPTIAWLKTIPLLSDETDSPFQRLCPMADCGNAFGRNAEPWEVNFMNPDLTIVLHRDPVGEWIGTSATNYWEPNGIGLADAQLFDNNGTVGRALQTLLLRQTSS